MTDAPIPPPGPAPREASADGRRELAYAVLGCLAGAGLALFAGTRAWVIEETARAAPLPAVTRTRTGAELAPWSTPLALVGLAGAGALLATRGTARALIGVVLFCCGGGLLAGAGYRVFDATSPGWPVLAGVGGVGLAAGGLVTVLRGRRWPAMGARYERRPAVGQARGPAGAAGVSGVGSGSGAGGGSGPAGGGGAGGRSGAGSAGSAGGGGHPSYVEGPVPGGAVGDALALGADGAASGSAAPDGAASGGVPSGGGVSGAAAGPASTVQTWEALDRGEDPTSD
jgi:hypothetical protein